MALGLTQPLTEMSTRNISWRWRWPVRRADNLTTFMCRLSRNLGASNSWNPQGLFRPVMGLIYPLPFMTITGFFLKLNVGDSCPTSVGIIQGSSKSRKNYRHYTWRLQHGSTNVDEQCTSKLIVAFLWKHLEYSPLVPFHRLFKHIGPESPTLSSKKNPFMVIKGRGKSISLQAWTGPEGSKRLRLQDFETVGTWNW
jgi:hypothetical protein